MDGVLSYIRLSTFLRYCGVWDSFLSNSDRRTGGIALGVREREDFVASSEARCFHSIRQVENSDFGRKTTAAHEAT